MKDINLLQSPRDRILWILANSGCKMERSRLRRCMGMKYTDLDPVIAELARDGMIRRDSRNMIRFKIDSITMQKRG